MFGKAKPNTALTDNAALQARVAAITTRSVANVAHQDSIAAAAPPTIRPPRQPTYKTGVINIANGVQLQVIVKNMSANGARVEFFRMVTLPQWVELTVANGKSQVKARVVWQNEGGAGLKFE